MGIVTTCTCDKCGYQHTIVHCRTHPPNNKMNEIWCVSCAEKHGVAPQLTAPTAARSDVNARLSAAAPDMFAALLQARGALLLDRAVDSAGRPFGITAAALKTIDAALAKATTP